MSVIRQKTFSKNKTGLRLIRCQNCYKYIASNKYDEHSQKCFKVKEQIIPEQKKSVKKLKLNTKDHRTAQSSQKLSKIGHKFTSNEIKGKMKNKWESRRPPTRNMIGNRKQKQNERHEYIVEGYGKKAEEPKEQKQSNFQQIQSQKTGIEINSEIKHNNKPISGFRISNTQNIGKKSSTEVVRGTCLPDKKQVVQIDEESVTSLERNYGQVQILDEEQIKKQEIEELNSSNQEKKQEQRQSSPRQSQIVRPQVPESPQEEELVEEELIRIQTPTYHDISNLHLLILNTSHIIQFIENMPALNDEHLRIMLSQLRQLNAIAIQVGELQGLGQNLGFRMAPLFATRIQELQTTIINQIGISIMRGFSNRLNTEFSSLLNQRTNLSFSVGFAPSEIENIFPEKLSLREGECSICLQDIQRGTRVRTLQCDHLFHPVCIEEWLKQNKKCPVCRAVQRAP